MASTRRVTKLRTKDRSLAGSAVEAGENQNESFIRVNEAYTVLKNQKSRAAYDAQLSRRQSIRYSWGDDIIREAMKRQGEQQHGFHEEGFQHEGFRRGGFQHEGFRHGGFREEFQQGGFRQQQHSWFGGQPFDMDLRMRKLGVFHGAVVNVTLVIVVCVCLYRHRERKKNAPVMEESLGMSPNLVKFLAFLCRKEQIRKTSAWDHKLQRQIEQIRALENALMEAASDYEQEEEEEQPTEQEVDAAIEAYEDVMMMTTEQDKNGDEEEDKEEAARLSDDGPHSTGSTISMHLSSSSDSSTPSTISIYSSTDSESEVEHQENVVVVESDDSGVELQRSPTISIYSSSSEDEDEENAAGSEDSGMNLEEPFPTDPEDVE
ncbi:unnamed protein product [Cyprideis torosa]|uniref:Uncharacterized protein n=1 Tax=Cyprideis torosa TaxID=163714 RepID=A0A7R8ZMD8_9CRUS|nr:unnamed protein product [Cyprideis torosa]CAG0893973.1 unnamed protein product [Cyprideis torosa]